MTTKKTLSPFAIKQRLNSSAPQKERLHVSPRGSRWAVRREGAIKASRVFDTQGKAVTFAKELSKSKSNNVVLHTKDGKIDKWK